MMDRLGLRRPHVVGASDDRLIPIAHGHRYAELIGEAESAVVQDCGHAMYFERPREFAEVTTEFLVRAAASPVE